MVYYTGDIHGQADPIRAFCRNVMPTREDVIVILGDVGANFHGPDRVLDTWVKEDLNGLGPTVFCIHGNHEMRPETISGYNLIDWRGGKVWQEPQYPNLLFAKDGEIFDLGGMRHLVIGGAYSVDKHYRLARGMGWWPDEQPSEEIKRFVESQIAIRQFDVILSHTCPYKYIPREMFLAGIDQSSVDNSTELWLDDIEARVEYKAWFCGHWHTNKRIDKMHFLFHGFESLEDIGGW